MGLGPRQEVRVGRVKIQGPTLGQYVIVSLEGPGTLDDPATLRMFTPVRRRYTYELFQGLIRREFVSMSHQWSFLIFCTSIVANAGFLPYTSLMSPPGQEGTTIPNSTQGDFLYNFEVRGRGLLHRSEPLLQSRKK